MFNTSITRTTKYGYSNTCTLADAMRNRSYNMLTNLAANFGSLGFAVSFKRECDKSRARKAVR